jgi:hypothetical protein
MSDDTHDAHYALREQLVDALRADLLGPFGGPDEVLTTDAPVTAYPVGVLYPQDVAEARAGQRQNDDEPGDELDREGAEDGLDTPMELSSPGTEEGGSELGVSFANQRRPSSMGMTFAVDTAVAPQIVVHIDAARYEPEDEHGRPVVKARRAASRTTEQQAERWRRRVLTLAPQVVDLVGSEGGDRRLPLHTDGLELRVRVRQPAAGKSVVSVTVTLVNTARAKRGELSDAASYYQPVLRIVGDAKEGPPFVERPGPIGIADDERSLGRLLYRHVPTFAVGHGCSARWDWTPPPVGAVGSERGAVAELRTEFLPTHEVLLTDSNPDIDASALGMNTLATGSVDEVCAALHGLLDQYDAWIEARRGELAALSGTDLADVAGNQVEACAEAAGRMRSGVELLAKEPKVFQAFCLANEVMASQQAQSLWVRRGRNGTPDLDEGQWRPFQISFMLLCIGGIANSEDTDRGIADLLWFPTGGGKTEAYLGLIAFTAFLRRLRDPENGGGVTVLMRYTLRLLTLQQFERASTLICAMEIVRRRRPDDLGAEPISIGMWVGASATPNRLGDAADSLTELRREPGRSLEKMNPVQLHRCPWCGTALDHRAYSVDAVQLLMRVVCPDPGCEFSSGDGLPVHLVDESVYGHHPTLIIATVDKFASMPWNSDCAHIFNRQDGSLQLPPELIVQDELHLISGPLGTLTGLYETAVDELANRPKVIASTATIRRAGDQGRALFDRDVRQFPPSGLDARDSWFAREAPRTQKATRQYVGLLATGTSQATLLVRAYAMLLHRARTAQTAQEVRDAYFTLVGYFNSLRVLAAAELQVNDDVHDRLKFLGDRDGLAAANSIREPVELSSRAGASDIPRRLKQVERRLPDPDTADVLLATNMISVGVDIDRLGLMAVMGQPQTTAEYIQATSRVGRAHPGLVAVLLNPARSRDRSHYEGFLSFHGALYREVESSSVTPFSPRSRDRGLHAVLVALVRMLIPEARDNKSARDIEDFHERITSEVLPILMARVTSVARSADEVANTRAEALRFVEWWRDRADSVRNLVYRSGPAKEPSLLSGFLDTGRDPGWETQWSLRDVDAESTLFLER